jgi:glyoxylase-like metal-dependent hydrolase (beta-lactamase superfamily II)
MFEFHILTIGRFTRNRFWGELDTRAYRDTLCTSTLVRGKRNILVDPSLPPGEMAKVLYDRSGLRPDAVGTVFITHIHGDHWMGLELFEQADWFMGDADLREMRASEDRRTRELAERIIPITRDSIEGMEPVPLPGHTAGTTGLLFETGDGRAMICGDAVMTRDFFRHELGYYNSLDLEQSARSIKKIAGLANWVVPGHDNYFMVR